MTKKHLFLLLSAVLAGTAGAADWPQFGGAARNNLSVETGLARNWPAAGPEMLWRVDVTPGYSGPAVRDGKVYFLEHEEDVSNLRCLSLESGEDLWRVKFDDPGEFKSDKYPGTRGTPTVTEDAVYAVTLYGTVVCVDLKSKKVEWTKNLQQDFGKMPEAWGFAQSPLIAGGLVVIAPLTESHGVIALDPKSGEIVWTNTDYFGEGYVSPTLIEIDGKEQILMVAGGEKPPKRRPEEASAESKPPRPTVVFALSPVDGHLLWDYKEWSCTKPIPHPVVVGNDKLFVTSGYKSVSHMFEVSEGNTRMLWETEEAASWIEQPVFLNGCLFVGGTTRKPKDGLICINLDGNVQWDTNEMEDVPAFNHLNMIGADGLLIGLDGKAGTLHLIEANPNEYKELASAKVVAEDGQNWAPIALSDGKLLVRDHDQMKCLNLK